MVLTSKAQGRREDKWNLRQMRGSFRTWKANAVTAISIAHERGNVDDLQRRLVLQAIDMLETELEALVTEKEKS